MTKAYPNLEYQQRLAVRGGAYPYTFKLLQAPSGMQIHTRKGQLKWTPTQANTTTTVSVQVTDSAGAILNHSFTLEVTTTGFYFVDATHGADDASGSDATPFKTLKGVQSLNLANDAILYVSSHRRHRPHSAGTAQSR